ncbi:Gx transporter family protein [Anaeroselena agilis]|uniref:Gx transporter family protein n=1 Tax=Anaeroselena agilis TaxID=3063788 RepID=A0ABU3P147_9FIRM|nr:Gx transporter family protein [Selenomonadales bacterium 4137-cl]
MTDTRRLVTLGLFVAIAGVLHAVEAWLPLPVPVPGVKLGLANIVSLAVIDLYGWREALVVAAARVVLGSLLGGAFLGPSFALGISGAAASTLAMAYAHSRWRPSLSLVGVSVLGAAVHNIAQITAAALLVASAAVFWYLPYLLLFALPTGLATGFTAAYFLAKLSRAGG